MSLVSNEDLCIIKFLQVNIHTLIVLLEDEWIPNKYKFSNKSLKLLKFICYDYLIRLFQLSNIFKKHRNKKTLIVNDLLLANYFIKI